MKQIARVLAANAAGITVLALGLVALAAAKLWRRWDRWKIQRLIGRVRKHRALQPQLL